MWFIEAENEESAVPDVPTKGRERFQSMAQPGPASPGALAQPAQGISTHCSIHLHREAAAILLSFSSSLKTLIKILNKPPLAPGLLGDYHAITNTVQVGRLHRAGSNPLSQLLNRD